MKVSQNNIIDTKAEVASYLALHALSGLLAQTAVSMAAQATMQAAAVVPYLLFWQQQGFLTAPANIQAILSKPADQVNESDQTALREYCQNIAGRAAASATTKNDLQVRAMHLPVLDKIMAVKDQENGAVNVQEMVEHLPGFETGADANRVAQTTKFAEQYLKDPDFTVSFSQVKQVNNRRVIDLTIPDGFSVDAIQIWFASNDIRLNGVRITAKPDGDGFVSFVYNDNNGVCPENLESQYVEVIVEWLYRGAASLKQAPQITPPAANPGLSVRVQPQTPAPQQQQQVQQNADSLGYDDFFADEVPEPAAPAAVTPPPVVTPPVVNKKSELTSEDFFADDVPEPIEPQAPAAVTPPVVNKKSELTSEDFFADDVPEPIEPQAPAAVTPPPVIPPLAEEKDPIEFDDFFADDVPEPIEPQASAVVTPPPVIPPLAEEKDPITFDEFFADDIPEEDAPEVPVAAAPPPVATETTDDVLDEALRDLDDVMELVPAPVHKAADINDTLAKLNAIAQPDKPAEHAAETTEEKPEEKTQLQDETLRSILERHELILETARSLKAGDASLENFFSDTALMQGNKAGYDRVKTTDPDALSISDKLNAFRSACLDANMAQARIINDPTSQASEKETAKSVRAMVDALVYTPLTMLTAELSDWLVQQKNPSAIVAPKKDSAAKPQATNTDKLDALYAKSSVVIREMPQYNKKYNPSIVTSRLADFGDRNSNSKAKIAAVTKGAEATYNNFRNETIAAMQAYRNNGLPEKEIYLQETLAALNNVSDAFLQCLGRFLGNEYFLVSQSDGVRSVSDDMLGRLSRYDPEDTVFASAEGYLADFKEANAILADKRLEDVLRFSSTYVQNNGMPNSEQETENFERELQSKFPKADQKLDAKQLKAIDKHAARLISKLDAALKAFEEKGKKHVVREEKFEQSNKAGSRTSNNDRIKVMRSMQHIHEQERNIAAAYCDLQHILSDSRLDWGTQFEIKKALSGCRENLSSKVIEGGLSNHAAERAMCLTGSLQSDVLHRAYNAVNSLGIQPNGMLDQTLTIMLRGTEYLSEQEIGKVADELVTASEKGADAIQTVLDNTEKLIQQKSTAIAPPEPITGNELDIERQVDPTSPGNN